MMKIHNNQWYQSDSKKPYIHPAVEMSFDEFYNGLLDCVAKGTVNMVLNADNDRVLFKYNQIKIWDEGWNKYSILARGLILSLNEKRVVAMPYPKFFNYGEGSYVLPDDSEFTAFEKLDGSLGILYNWKGKWEVATAGSFTSDQAIWATKYINNTANLNVLNSFYYDCTILGEIIYPENKIVIDYDNFEGFVVHGAYNILGHELHYHYMLGNTFNCDVVKAYSYKDLPKIVELCKSLPHNQEGFVIHFNNGYRVKIKGDEYVRVHRLISNVTPLRIWESMLAGDDIDALKKELPEEFRETIDEYVSKISIQIMKLTSKVALHSMDIEKFTDKELGLWIKDPFNITPKNIKDLLFMVRKKDFFRNMCIGGSECRKKIFKMFKPVGNKI